MDLPKSADVVIIGGGVMGASTLYHLAAHGQKNIVLLEQEEFFGQGATGRCAGGVRYQFSTEVNIRLSLVSLPMLERFKEEIGQEVNYRKCGYLLVATDEEVVRAFERNVRLQHSLGVQTEWLSGDEVRGRLPLMRFDDALAGTFHASDGLVDPNSVVAGYLGAAQRLGARALGAAGVTGIRVSGGKVRGVQTRAGSIDAAVVVNAAGPWAAQVGQMAGVQIPIQPIRRQMFTTSAIPQIPADFTFVIDFAQSLYFHPEGDGLMVGMSNHRQETGFGQSVDEEFELLNLEAAIARMPLLERASRAAHAPSRLLASATRKLSGGR